MRLCAAIMLGINKRKGLRMDIPYSTRHGGGVRERTSTRLGFAFSHLVQMLLHAREHSPAITSSNNGPPAKKRKHNPPSHNSAADSPAPSDPASLSNTAPAENVVLPAYLYDLSTRPRLTISRAPAFIPIADDS